MRAGKSLKEAELELMRELGIAEAACIKKPVQSQPKRVGFAEEVLQKVFDEYGQPRIQHRELQLMRNDASDQHSRRYNPDWVEHAAREPATGKNFQPQTKGASKKQNRRTRYSVAGRSRARTWREQNTQAEAETRMRT